MTGHRDQLTFDFNKPAVPQTPRNAAIVIFPAEKMIGDLRDTGAEMALMSKRDRERVLSKRLARYQRRRLRMGASVQDVERNVRVYEAAIRAAIQRQHVIEYLYGDDDQMGGSA